MQEDTVGIREAKARLSEIVARVRRGHAVLLTLRGRGVARIVPVTQEERTLGDRLAELERAGIVEPLRGPSSPLPTLLRIRPDDLAQRYLQEDRGR